MVGGMMVGELQLPLDPLCCLLPLCTSASANNARDVPSTFRFVLRGRRSVDLAITDGVGCDARGGAKPTIWSLTFSISGTLQCQLRDDWSLMVRAWVSFSQRSKKQGMTTGGQLRAGYIMRDMYYTCAHTHKRRRKDLGVTEGCGGCGGFVGPVACSV